MGVGRCKDLTVERRNASTLQRMPLPNRIENCFAQLRSAKRRGFIPYICAGDPSFAKTAELAFALEQAGANLLELGLPFSDPLADGIVNQLAAQRALAAGATVHGVFDCIREIRRRSQIPIVLYSYLNPIFQFGFDKFHRDAEAAGVDGLLILDLPPEEDFDESGVGGFGKRPTPKVRQSDGLVPRRAFASKRSNDEARGLVHIRLVAPTTPAERMVKIAANAKGFLYYVSREGVTGVCETIASSLAEKIAQLRKVSDLPIAVGFGISRADQAREVARQADAVVVGSAIVDQIAQHGNDPDLIESVVEFAKPLSDAIKSV